MHACFLYSMLPPTSPRATACPATPHLQETLRFNFFPQRSTLLRPSGVRGKMHRMWIIVATCSELNERLIRSSTSVVLTSGTKQLAEYSYVVTPISSSVEKTILLLLVSGAGAFLNQVFMYSCLFVYPWCHQDALGECGGDNHIWVKLPWTYIFPKNCHFFCNFDTCFQALFALVQLFLLFLWVNHLCQSRENQVFDLSPQVRYLKKTSKHGRFWGF